jgi:hypothetical protein
MSSGGEFSYPAEVVINRARSTRETIEGLQEHIQTDHEALQLIWNMHSPDTDHPRLAFCVADGQRFPCRTRRALQGERFE